MAVEWEVMSNKADWIDITGDLTEKGIAELKPGMILKFDQGGDPFTLKVVRNKHGKVWAKPIQAYTPEQLAEMEVEANKMQAELEREEAELENQS
jgi:hypothetical protein